MPTVNFSVPSEVKKAFDRAFAGRNKSAVVAEFMRSAVEEERLRERRQKAFDLLTERRTRRPVVTAARARAVRREGRP